MTGALPLLIWLAALPLVVGPTQCTNISDSGLRLKCYDKEHGYTPPSSAAQNDEAPKKKKEAPEWASHLMLVDDASLTKLGTGAATLGVTHNKGKDASLIKAGVRWTGDAFNAAGWQPVVALAINHDTLASNPSDQRALYAGVYGSFASSDPRGPALDTFGTISSREDLRKHTASDLLTLDNTLVLDALHNGQAFTAGENAYLLLPRFGVQEEHRRRVAAGMSTGSLLGYFYGVGATFWPGKISNRMQLTATGQIYHDITANHGIDKRRNNYAKLSIDYYLYDPAQTTAWMQPIVGIDREVGNDPVAGSFGNNRTTFALKLKVTGE